METLKILTFKLLAIVFIIFALVIANTSKAGAAVAFIAAVIIWPTIADKISKATGKKWLAPVAGVLLALIISPITMSVTKPSDTEMAAIEAQRAVKKQVVEEKEKEKRIAKAEKEASERVKNSERDAEMTEIKLQRIARELIKTRLKDPNSAEFRNQKGVCGEINAKNSFGGFTGFRRFVAISEEIAFIEGDGLSGSGFQQIWDKACN